MKRVVSLTGTGVRFKGDKIPIYDWPLNWFISLIDPKRVQDGKNHAEVLIKSELDWTLIRVLKLTNCKRRVFKLKTGASTKLFTSRLEVAAAILEVLEKNTFIKQTPVLTNY